MITTSLDFEVHGAKVTARQLQNTLQLDFLMDPRAVHGDAPVWIGSLADPSSAEWPESWEASLPNAMIQHLALPGTELEGKIVSWHVARALLEAAAVCSLLDSGLLP